MLEDPKIERLLPQGWNAVQRPAGKSKPVVYAVQGGLSEIASKVSANDAADAGTAAAYGGEDDHVTYLSVGKQTEWYTI